MSTQRHNIFGEAEDRALPQTSQQHASGFPSMERSSFAAYCEQVGRRDHDDFDNCVPPIGYVDHHNSFKRDRSFSAGGHFDDVASHDGDDSMIDFESPQGCQNTQYMSIYDRNPDLELDFEELNDFMELEAPIKKEDEEITITTTSPLNIFDPVSQAQNPHEDDEEAIYANEREECCGSQEQRDLALDSTYHSLFEQQDPSFDNIGFDQYNNNFDRSIEDEGYGVSQMIN